MSIEARSATAFATVAVASMVTGERVMRSSAVGTIRTLHDPSVSFERRDRTEAVRPLLDVGCPRVRRDGERAFWASRRPARVFDDRRDQAALADSRDRSR